MEPRTTQISLSVFKVFVITAIAILCALFLSKYDNESKQDTFYKHGAVASDAGVCSDIGVNAMKDNGTAVDAAIATMFCLSLIHPHSSGIGGGGFMLIYQRSKKKATFLDFRETAPGASTVDMFVNKTKDISKKGKLSIAVPGELLATYTAWKMHGKLPWKRLVEPTIDLATNGYKIDEPLSIVLKDFKKDLIKERGFREIYYHNDDTPRKQGETVTDPIFAKTLTEISQNPMSFYNGSIAREIVKDIQERGGIITEGDLKNYTVKERRVLESSITNDDILYTTSAPSSGSTMIMILNILKGFNFSSEDFSSANIVQTWHRILEAFKFSYAYRPYLGDPDFDSSVEKSMELQINSTLAEELRQMIMDNTTHDIPAYYGGYYRNQPDHGTSHMSVLGPTGDAVSVTTTIGNYFGARIRSYNTGIVYNARMCTYTVGIDSYQSYQGPKTAKANCIAPGKRSLSSACPTIVVDKSGSVKMVVGSSGALRIPPAVATVLMNKLWFRASLHDSISAPRLHHQLFPNQFKFETRENYRMEQSVIDGLEALGHKSLGWKRYGAVQGIYRDNSGRIYATSDPRKSGVASGF